MNKSYHIAITYSCLPEDAFKKLSDIPSWWTKDFEGRSNQLGDEFIICHPGAHYAKHKVVEYIPGHRLVWLVTESRLDWLANKEEWTGTRMIFELSPGELHFTHEDLTAEKESYARCSEGWTLVIGEKLTQYLIIAL